MKKIFLSLFFPILVLTGLQAKVVLPSIFADHMVLQQQSDAPMWGWAKPMEELLVITSWDGKRYETTADNKARWQVDLTTPKAGGPYRITIVGNNTIVIDDVLIGEVWVCSGQSNMEWSARAGIESGTEEIFKASNPAIRLFQVNQQSADSRQLDCAGQWARCTPETMIDFSAVAYFFGQRLQEHLNVPIGLINTSWGGTPAEAWTNPEVISENERLHLAAAKLKEVPWCPVKPGVVYNAMLAPLIPYRMAGVIWYQGESNTANYETYAELFATMIANWRKEWDREFPFYYVQIAPFTYGRDYEGALIREAQLKSLSIPNTGMVVVSDIGNVNDIHPRNKIDVGRRLASWALNKTYGIDSIVYSGPLYKEMKIEKSKIRISFHHAANGLVAREGTLTHFEIAGEDRKFVDAQAKIDGNTVLVYAKAVKNPVAVRYAFSNTATPTLFNKAGLPASSFRTDLWEMEVK
ncbi:MAG: sialate O-acetylesterase [Cyclobacteriaceae bacterium]|nr:sialate O-acetylesterase [Cyclobacteriaceae bacterium]